ncbi:MAG: hypothetical protein COA38_20330 [Fluviicola sp.]|nr:MAG: hypothetical protein COA38_20330 [Fluviicola sp.]
MAGVINEPIMVIEGMLSAFAFSASVDPFGFPINESVLPQSNNSMICSREVAEHLGLPMPDKAELGMPASQSTIEKANLRQFVGGSFRRGGR